MHRGISATDYAHFWEIFSLVAALPLGTLAWLALRALQQIACGLEQLVLVVVMGAQEHTDRRGVKGGEVRLELPTSRRLN